MDSAKEGTYRMQLTPNLPEHISYCKMVSLLYEGRQKGMRIDVIIASKEKAQSFDKKNSTRLEIETQDTKFYTHWNEGVRVLKG